MSATYEQSRVLVRPYVTEHSAAQVGRGGGSVYTFLVAPAATKPAVAAAVFALYGVRPAKVNVLNSKPKRVLRQRRPGRVAGFRKAMVFLKPGQTINLS